jgi:hypothetical protein
MKLSDIENKIYKRMNVEPPKLAGKGGFILSDGMFVSTSNHAGTCKSIGITLRSAIKSGLCRFFSRQGLGGNVAVFEYRKLTDKQTTAIKSFLKYNEFHHVICGGETIESQTRAIRSVPSIHKKD